MEKSRSLPRPAFAVFIVSMALLAVGLWFCFRAESLPVYTDPHGPERIDNELISKIQEQPLPFAEWYSRLRAIETPHKRLFDLSSGLIAASVALPLAGGIWLVCTRAPWRWKIWVLIGTWMGLWLLRIPCSVWYYGLRQQRYDYPSWGDSIAIGIAGETLTWLVGGAVSSGLLYWMLKHRPLPARLEFSDPRSISEWIRAGWLILWLGFLVCVFAAAIPDGDVGAILSIPAASVILLYALTVR